MLENTKVYILGNLSINVACSTSSHVSDYINMLITNNFFQIISKPTRVTKTSSKIIDPIITNDIIRSLTPGVIRTALSDHYSTFWVIPNTTLTGKQSPVYKRDMKIFQSDDYCEDLSHRLYNFFAGLPEITPDNYNDIFNKFIDLIKTTINKHASLRKLSRKEIKFKQKPWFMKGIKTSIKTKQNLYVSQFPLS